MSQENVDQNELDNDLIDDEDSGLDADTEVDSDAPAEPAKHKEFLKKYGMYVAMGVVAVGIVGYKMIASPSAPTPKAPVTQNQEQQNQTQVNPVNPVLPGQEMQASSPELEQQASSASEPELKPLQQEIVGDKQQQSGAVANGLDSAQAQAQVNPAQAQVNPNTVVNQPNNNVSVSGEMTKALSDLKGSVDRFVDVQTRMETKVSSLEARVSALESNSNHSHSHNETKQSYRKPAFVERSDGGVETKKKVKKAKESKAASHVASVKIEEKKVYDDSLLESAPEVTQDIIVPKKEVPAPKLRAVMKGRFWIATPEGETSFSTDATLPNGAKVIKIDPENNQVITSKGVLKMPKE